MRTRAPSPEQMARDAKCTPGSAGWEYVIYAVRAERARAFAESLDCVAPADGAPDAWEARGGDRPSGGFFGKATALRTRRLDRMGEPATMAGVVMGRMCDAYTALPRRARAVIERGKLAAQGRMPVKEPTP